MSVFSFPPNFRYRKAIIQRGELRPWRNSHVGQGVKATLQPHLRPRRARATPHLLYFSLQFLINGRSVL